MFATRLQGLLYRNLAKPVFFAQDPEKIHDRVTAAGSLLGKSFVTKVVASAMFRYRHPALEQDILGISFPNPVGLAAGFDKNARLTGILPSVGFGFEEVGSITGEPCPGNSGTRLWRLPKTEGLVVYYGLMNEGCEAIAERLSKETFGFPVGISVAKTNCQDTVEVGAGIADYAKAFRAFTDIGDYITVNISCPNAFGGEPFGSPERLHLLLTELDKIETDRPVFLKMAADLSTDDLDGLIAVADGHRVDGIILSNLTKRREAETIDQEEIRGIDKGGISGRPCQDPSNRLISHLYRTAGERYTIIGCGGIFTAEDAYEKIRRGASLVQMITGMIFRGPQTIGEINRGLVRLLHRDGFESISEAIGTAHRT